MFAFTYRATFRKDKEGRVLVLFPDFPRSATDGADAAEAMAQAADCLGSSVAFALAYKEDIPRPTAPRRGQKIVPVPLWIAPKLALYWRMRELGLNNSQLARKLGVRETVVRRMLDPNHATRSERLQRVLELLGQKVVLAVEDAA
jgi:antitoxin HicB